MQDTTPQTSRGDDTTRRIMDTAAEVFSEVGYAGARVDAIAKKANVNKAMIYYHIGDKKRCIPVYCMNISGKQPIACANC